MLKKVTKRFPTAALYVRVATSHQAEQQLSADEQLRELRDYCAANYIRVVDEFIDLGASGLDEARPEFLRMLCLACSEQHPYDHVLVQSFSRITRDQIMLQRGHQELLSHGVRLQAITASMADCPEGRMMMSLYHALDEYNSAEASKATHRKMCRLAREGYWPGSIVPDGYAKVSIRVGGKTRVVLEPDAKRAGVIAYIFELAVNGTGQGPMGIKAIAEHLNGLGIGTRRGGKWHISAIHKVLSSSTYIGEHYFNRTLRTSSIERPRSEWILIPVKPLISTETFEAVARTLNAKSRKSRRAARIH